MRHIFELNARNHDVLSTTQNLPAPYNGAKKIKTDLYFGHIDQNLDALADDLSGGTGQILFTQGNICATEGNVLNKTFQNELAFIRLVFENLYIHLCLELVTDRLAFLV